MTPARLATIQRHIASCATEGEMIGLRWGLKVQGELTTDVLMAIRDKAEEHGWSLAEKRSAA